MDHPTINWEKDTQEKFQQMLSKIPAVLRGTAEKRVAQRAERIVREDNRSTIGEKDMVDAFFAETPFGFHGPMKTDMQALHIDYMKYGHPK
jgi:hypothetical protein